MDRTTYIDIGGKEYPMRFSLAASKAISQKYGSLKKMAESIIQKGEDTQGEAFDAITWILEVLIRQGCAYKNVFETDLPIPENAPVKDGKYTPMSCDDIAIGIDVSDIGEVQRKIFLTMGNGQNKTVKTEEKDNKKNE